MGIGAHSVEHRFIGQLAPKYEEKQNILISGKVEA